jgi:hypothetical protein
VCVLSPWADVDPNLWLARRSPCPSMRGLEHSGRPKLIPLRDLAGVDDALAAAALSSALSLPDVVESAEMIGLAVLRSWAGASP